MVANTLDSSSTNGQQGSPNPDNLGGQSVQPPSTSAPTQSPDQLRALVADVVKEALQDPNILKGMKDRRFNQIQGTLDEFSPVLERVRGILTPEQQAQFSQIQRDAEFEQLKQAVYGKPSTQTGATTGGTQSGAAVDVEAIVKSLQFADNDPALAALKIKYQGNPGELVQAAADLRLQQLKTPNPTPGTALPQQGTPPPSDKVDVSALSAEYSRLIKNPSKNYKRMKEIEDLLNKA